MESKVVWKQGMAFDAHLNGHTFAIDADAAVGGQDSGPRPKGLVMTALAGCTAMDVISILQKARQPVEGFEVSVEGELSAEHPKRYTAMVIRYAVTGAVDPERIKRAVQLSEERYCGVSATLRPTVPIGHEIWLNGEKIA